MVHCTYKRGVKHRTEHSRQGWRRRGNRRPVATSEGLQSVPGCLFVDVVSANNGTHHPGQLHYGDGCKRVQDRRKENKGG